MYIGKLSVIAPRPTDDCVEQYGGEESIANTVKLVLICDGLVVATTVEISQC